MSTIDNAVTFLRDPNVQSAPNEKKLAFLQAKGLNQPEIDEAMRLSAVPSYNPATATMNYRNRQAQLQNQRDWRDWFIMTIVGGSVAWLGMSLARKYLLPALQPPTESQIQQTQDALTAKYDEAAAILAQLQQDSAELKQSMNEQQEKVDAGLDSVKQAVSEMRLADQERSETIKTCKEEIDAIKEMLPKMMEKNKEAQSISLGELQQELKSLKSLMAARPNGPITSTPSSTPYSTTGRFGISSPSASPNLPPIQPGIPAWQRTATSSADISRSGSPKPATNNTPSKEAEVNVTAE